MDSATKNYLRQLDRKVTELSSYLTAASHYSTHNEHYSKAMAARYEERVLGLPKELADIAEWARVNRPRSEFKE